MKKEKIIAAGITFMIIVGLGVYMVGPTSIWNRLSAISYLNHKTEKPMVEKPSKKKGRGARSSRSKRRSTSNNAVGAVVDQLDGVKVYYNGRVRNVLGRNKTPDGYNLGLKYQCVEFVKRYYYQHFGHKMPNPGGNAADYYNPSLADGAYNADRGLYQFRNGSSYKPRKGDVVVFIGPNYTQFGHMAIISGVFNDHIQIIQQNPGPGNPSRVDLPMIHEDGRWTVRAREFQGWLGIR